jgi:NADP-dependent 3-hydroxy acid dehydrogenase YdfG
MAARTLLPDRNRGVPDDRVLLVTGASTGIGAATARAAVADGWSVVLSARSEDKLEELAGELGDERTLVKRCDVTEFGEQEALVQAAVDRFGRIDAAFANAGFGAKRGFLEESPEQWRSMVLTNVLGPAYTIRAVLPHFNERGSGHFLLTSSVAGRRALPGSLYAATKWAVTGMGESLRQELRAAGRDVKVTLVEPGMVDTPFFDDGVSDALEPEDIARIVMFVLSQPERVDINEVLVRPVKQAG